MFWGKQRQWQAWHLLGHLSLTNLLPSSHLESQEKTTLPFPQFLLALPVSSIPPIAVQDGGARVNSDTLLERTLLASRGETGTTLSPALCLLNWGREVVKWSSLCFGEEGENRVYCRSVFCQYCNIVMLKCIILKYNKILI